MSNRTDDRGSTMSDANDIGSSAGDALAGEANPTEQEMRDAKVPWLETPEKLTAYISSLVERRHDYGTCVYAMSMAATATFYFVAKKLGTTGFQSSRADMDILRRTRGWEWGRILDYADLLYPQYVNEERFPSAWQIIQSNAGEFAKRAREKMTKNDSSDVDPDVWAHWRHLASLAPDEASA